MTQTHHDGKPFGADFVRKNLEGVCYNHWRIGNIIEKVEAENEWNSRWCNGEQK